MKINKPITENSSSYKELDEFKDNFFENIYITYPINVNRVKFYQFIFISFGFIFLVLNWILFSQKENWIYQHIFLNKETLKGIIVTFTFFLSLASFTLGLSLRADKEAARHLEKKALMRLKGMYIKAKIELKVSSFSLEGRALNTAFQEIKHHLKEKRHETEFLLEQITRTKHLDTKGQMILTKQALEKLQIDLVLLLNTFRKLESPN